MIAIIKDWAMYEATSYHFVEIGEEKEAEENLCWFMKNLIDYNNKGASVIATGENFTWFEEGSLTFEEAKEDLKHLFRLNHDC